MMKDVKALVWEYWQQHPLENIHTYVSDQINWNGPHPINHLSGVDQLIQHYWQPLLHAVPDLTRKPDVFMGGTFEGNPWISATGYFSGTFTHDWLDIPATNKPLNIRFGEFLRVENGKIVEQYIILDLIDVMQQAGFQVVPPSKGEDGFVIPGPAAGDGILLTAQDEAEGQRSLQLVEAMLFDGLLQYDGKSLSSMGMVRFWDPGMLWYGPTGIGTTRGLKEFEDFHQGPFLVAFPDRRGGNHKARIAEGNYVASTGWPSITTSHVDEWLGHPGTNQKITMRVMDWWKREGDWLIENWVFIDIIEVFQQFDVDLFDRMREST